MARLLAVLLGLAVLVGAPPAGRADAAVRTLATFHQTGGYVGVRVHVVVRTDGLAVVARRGEPTVRRRLRAVTLRRLRAALQAAHLERPLGPSQSGCADCFSYSIGYGGHRAVFDDATMPARMRDAVAQLRRVADGGR